MHIDAPLKMLRVCNRRITCSSRSLFLPVVDNVNNDVIINECAEKQFQGKIVSKTSDGKCLLQSKDLLDVLQKVNAIKYENLIEFDLCAGENIFI